MVLKSWKNDWTPGMWVPVLICLYSSERFPMKTNMTGLRWLSKVLFCIFLSWTTWQSGSLNFILIFPMLKLLFSIAQGRKDFWKTLNPVMLVSSEWLSRSTRVLSDEYLCVRVSLIFQAKLATSSIMVNICVNMNYSFIPKVYTVYFM